MPWKKQPNAAMYAGADWSGLVKQVANTTAAQARRIALLDPSITFFFFCREAMYLGAENGNPPRQFAPGDAVFFRGQPWYGEAGQCDAYEKDFLTVAYMNPQTPDDLRAVTNYTLPNGLPAVDVVCLFGANYASATPPYLRAHNNKPPTTDPLNPGIQQAVDGGANSAVSYVQSQGITVLLTVINGWAPVGWSEFTSQADATAFATYLQTDIVDKYGLDGIDIDDEYSTGTPNDTSLIMVTSSMKSLMPDKLITKALFADSTYFQATWNGTTLAQNLTYGWEMSYWAGGPSTRLAPYLGWGMNYNQLALGFSNNQSIGDIQTYAAELPTPPSPEPYAGGMLFMFNLGVSTSVNDMDTIVQTLCGVTPAITPAPADAPASATHS